MFPYYEIHIHIFRFYTRSFRKHVPCRFKEEVLVGLRRSVPFVKINVCKLQRDLYNIRHNYN